MRSPLELSVAVSCLALSSALIAASAITPTGTSDEVPAGRSAAAGTHPTATSSDAPDAPARETLVASVSVEVELTERIELVTATKDPPDVTGTERADEPRADDGSGDAEEASADEPAEDPTYVAADGAQIDAERIRSFLADRGAPLAEQADELIAAGIAHDVDPRVVVGIAVAESSGGEALPPGSHNAWGWSGSGPKGLAAWSSWPEAIDTYTRRLGDGYDTDHVDESFARTYCPPNWRWWLDTVTWVVDEI